MHAEEEAFWIAINDDKEDNTNWLVFADWLRERDDPRADAVCVIIKCGLTGNNISNASIYNLWCWEEYAHRGYITSVLSAGPSSFGLCGVMHSMIPKVWFAKLGGWMNRITDEKLMKSYGTQFRVRLELIKAWVEMSPEHREYILTMTENRK